MSTTIHNFHEDSLKSNKTEHKANKKEVDNMYTNPVPSVYLYIYNTCKYLINEVKTYLLNHWCLVWTKSKAQQKSHILVNMSNLSSTFESQMTNKHTVKQAGKRTQMTNRQWQTRLQQQRSAWHNTAKRKHFIKERQQWGQRWTHLKLKCDAAQEEEKNHKERRVDIYSWKLA